MPAARNGAPILPRLDKVSRRLIIPAAGVGSRLGVATPKFLTPVAGRPMIDWLVALAEPWIDHTTLVVSPRYADDAEGHLRGRLSFDVVVQDSPSGMLDAVSNARSGVLQSDATQIWIFWCDQIALQPITLARLASEAAQHAAAGLVMPVVRRANPYIHFERDERGRIIGVRHRREGDAMPEIGEGDCGCFCFSREAYLDLLPQYEQTKALGQQTGERNLLPFIPWLAARRPIITFPCSDAMESIGVNTPDERQAVEAFLLERSSA